MSLVYSRSIKNPTFSLLRQATTAARRHLTTAAHDSSQTNPFLSPSKQQTPPPGPQHFSRLFGTPYSIPHPSPLYSLTPGVRNFSTLRDSGLRSESLKMKTTGLSQKIAAVALLPLIVVYKKVSSALLLNLSLFWHMNHGIEEILADYVHHEITRNWILVFLRLFLLIAVKDVFLAVVYA